MHNYFVSFIYIDNSIHDNKQVYDNCIIVDSIDTSTSTASQLDSMIERFTHQIKQQIPNADTVTILNLNKMN